MAEGSNTMHVMALGSICCTCALFFVVICPDGYEEAANSSCSLCEVGSYRTKDIDNIANKMCTECDGYWTTAEEGSVTESQCSICTLLSQSYLSYYVIAVYFYLKFLCLVQCWKNIYFCNNLGDTKVDNFADICNLYSELYVSAVWRIFLLDQETKLLVLWSIVHISAYLQWHAPKGCRLILLWMGVKSAR